MLTETPLRDWAPWKDSSAPAPATGPLRETKRCDVAVVGAGVLGLSLALHAAELGCNVLVLEAGEIGAGASGLNSGRVIPHFVGKNVSSLVQLLGRRRGESFVAQIASSADLVFELVERYGIECEADRSGWIRGAHARMKVKDLRRKRDEWSALGRHLTWLAADEAKALTGSSFYAGLLDPSGGHLNPLSYVRGLARAAAGFGAGIYTDTCVNSVRKSEGLWHLQSDEGEVLAKEVFLCVNAWSETLAPDVHRSVLPLDIFAVATAPLSPVQKDSILPQRHVVSDTRNTVFSYHLDAEGHLITGGVSFKGFKARWRMEREFRRHLSHRLGLPHDLAFRNLWRGRAIISPVTRPHIYRVDDRLWAPMACNGTGIASCTAVGKMCAEWVAGTAGILSPEDPHPIPLHGIAHRLNGALMSLSSLQDHLIP